MKEIRFDLRDPWIAKAYELAENLHRGQVDKSGEPYIDHLIEVANHVEGRDAIIVALLHDAMEDQGVTTRFLMNQGFEPSIIDAVILLTRTGNDYENYIMNIKHHPLARMVKLADMRHNSDLLRLKTIGEKDLLRREKYLKYIQILED